MERRMDTGAIEATLKGMQERQNSMHEQNSRIFERIMDKLDVLPGMQRDIAVMGVTMTNLNEKLSGHIKDDDELFGKVDKRFDKTEAEIEDLKKESWIKRGIAIAIGTASGFMGGYIHK